jgi:hypothetical protein
VLVINFLIILKRDESVLMLMEMDLSNLFSFFRERSNFYSLEVAAIRWILYSFIF